MSIRVSIHKRFKDFALDAAFVTQEGSTAILGASGSGKSMTLRCIAGIETPTAGRIQLDDQLLYDKERRIDLPPQKRRVGFLFQNYALFPNMTIQENIACGVRGNKAEKTSQAEAQLQRFRLDGLGDRYPNQLSGGQQQRAALGRMLASHPTALLLDEPFSALDAYLREEMQWEMLPLLEEYGANALMVTHSRDEAYKLCPNTIVLEAGKVLAAGPTKALFKNPGRAHVARLTGCKNITSVQVLDAQHVFAPAWGLTLQVDGPIASDVTQIGIRAHDFHPAAADSVNALRPHWGQSVESPFEWNLRFHNGDIPEGDGEKAALWWKFDKTYAGPHRPDFLAVAPDDILLLTD